MMLYSFASVKFYFKTDKICYNSDAFLMLGRMLKHVHRNIILDHINQPCAGLGCVEIEFPWKPHRIEFCASINNYLQSADRLYFSHSINCISFTTSTVFLLLYQQYFSHNIICISLTISTVFLSLGCLYYLYSCHLLIARFLYCCTELNSGQGSTIIHRVLIGLLGGET